MITRIVYSRTINLGNFESHKAEVEIQVQGSGISAAAAQMLVQAIAYRTLGMEKQAHHYMRQAFKAQRDQGENISLMLDVTDEAAKYRTVSDFDQLATYALDEGFDYAAVMEAKEAAR